MIEKKLLVNNISPIGHLGSGKSTLLGHLIFKCGGIDQRTIEKFALEAAEMGKPGLKYAWVLDNLRAEREKGGTIHGSIWKFETTKYSFTVTDVPGNIDYIGNFISGINTADAAILVVSAAHGEFEAGISQNGQTIEHSEIAHGLGINQLIVAVNKMDEKTVEFSEARFNEIKIQVSDYLKKVGYKPKEIPFIPCSAWLGDNLIEKSANMPWYTGKTLYEVLNDTSLPIRPLDKPLRIPLSNVFKIGGIGTVPIGRVEYGILKAGMVLKFAPAELTTEVKSVKKHHESIAEAYPGDQIGFNVKNLEVSDFTGGVNGKSTTCGFVASNIKDNPARECESFEANIILRKRAENIAHNYPNEIKIGSEFIIHIHTASVSCKISEIISKIHIDSDKVLEENLRLIRPGEKAAVKFVPMKPLVVETFAEYPRLGKFVMMSGNVFVGFGTVNSVVKKELVKRN